jgi:hypothetical protein
VGTRCLEGHGFSRAANALGASKALKEELVSAARLKPCPSTIEFSLEFLQGR